MKRLDFSFVPLQLLCGALAAATLLPAAAGTTTTTVVERPGRGTNHVEVSGNTSDPAKGPCRPDGDRRRVNVNSVNIDGRALEGKTIVVTGKNSDMKRDCAQGTSDGSANVNSVNIR